MRPTDVLEAVLLSQLERVGSVAFSDEAFDATYQAFVDYFASDVVEFQLLAALTHFTTTASTMALCDELQVVGLSNIDRESIRPGQLFGLLDVGLENHGLAYRWRARKRIGDASTTDDGFTTQRDNELALIRCALLALRLLKPGGVGLSQYSFTRIGWDPTPMSISGRLDSERSPGITYALEETDLPRLHSMVARLRAVNSGTHPRLTTALRWFTAGYERTTLEDRFIANAIALESLLGDQHGSTAYRFALRGALLLADDPTGRKPVQDHLRSLYKVRSELVHGQSIEASLERLSRRTAPAEFLSTTEGYLRDAIDEFLKALSQGLTEPAITLALDECLLTAKGPFKPE